VYVRSYVLKILRLEFQKNTLPDQVRGRSGADETTRANVSNQKWFSKMLG